MLIDLAITLPNEVCEQAQQPVFCKSLPKFGGDGSPMTMSFADGKVPIAPVWAGLAEGEC
jgi:hypothetical protein